MPIGNAKNLMAGIVSASAGSMSVYKATRTVATKQNFEVMPKCADFILEEA
jgi:hypothetical protein